jgi:mono/diheme cytochrome c family protein
VVIHRVAQLVQLFAVVAVAAFGVMLFANEPTLLSEPAAAQEVATDESPAPEESDAVDNGEAAETVETVETVATVDTAPQIDAAVIFAERCASCHGSTGGGGIGPALSGGQVAAAFPNIEDQVTVVRDGRGRMPSFGNRLADDQLRAVVRFTRTL